MRKVGCFGVILALVAIVALFLVVQGWGGAGPAPRTLTVQVAQGSSLAAAATELEKAGAHVLGLKDMAGLLKPAAARKLIATLRNETSLPMHLHTHDTSGAAAATVLAAVDAGVDAIDAAMDALSGTTSQPTLAPTSSASLMNLSLSYAPTGSGSSFVNGTEIYKR